MNKRRLKVISDWLRAGAPHKKGIDGFDMRETVGNFSSCGTTACIGGAAVCFFEKGFSPNRDLLSACDLNRRGGKLLGLNLNLADVLFFPEDCGGPTLYEITVEWAANCIDHLIETGEVDWWATKPKA